MQYKNMYMYTVKNKCFKNKHQIATDNKRFNVFKS